MARRNIGEKNVGMQITLKTRKRLFGLLIERRKTRVALILSIFVCLKHKETAPIEKSRQKMVVYQHRVLRCHSNRLAPLPDPPLPVWE